MTEKQSASQRLKIQEKQWYDSLTEKQKKQIDKIKQDSFMKQTAEAQKRGFKTKTLKQKVVKKKQK